MSTTVDKSLQQLGQDIRKARIKRRIGIDSLADRAGVNRKTIMRLERGEPGVSLGTLGMVLLVFGEESRLANLIDPAEDHVGMLLEEDRLPKSVRPRRKPTPDADPVDGPVGNDDGYGFGF